MSGTIRFDDEHIVKFTLDADNLIINLEVIIEDGEYTKEVDLHPVG